jgi:hypothetical protein
MEEAARLLLSIAQSGPQRTGMLIPESNIKLLGDYLVEQLQEALSVNCIGQHSKVGEYPQLESGILRNSVAYEILKTDNIATGIRLGYVPHYRDDDHDYGEILEHRMGRLGVNELISSEMSSIKDVFNVGDFTVTPEPYQMIEV